MTKDKFFPINTPTACQLKWTWSTIRLYNGATSSCHRVKSDIITSKNFNDFHNTPSKIQDRKLMLEGRWPSGGCEYCKKIEDVGGTSDRMFHLTIPNIYPDELDYDLERTNVKPKIVEVYFDNVCNLSCIYCWDGFSSKIKAENNKFGRFEKNGVVIDNRTSRVNDFDALTEKFWEWMESNAGDLSRFHFLGGEPLYQKQFSVALDFFKKNPCPNLEFNVISNLIIDHDKFVGYIQQLKSLVASKRLKRFDLIASLDCLGKEQEYVRYGINLDLWRQNFEYAAKNKWIKLSINQTITSLTIKTSADAIAYVKSFSENNREIGHYFGLVVGENPLLHPQIFGPGFFDKDFEQILQAMPDQTAQEKQAKLYMQGIQKQLQSCVRDQKKINQLVTLLDEIDRRRNLNWRNIFPWLTNETTIV